MQRNELHAGRFQDVRWVDRTTSTNDDLLRSAIEDPTAARVLLADEQSAGRGRMDRSWEQAAGGGLLISFFVPWVDATSAHLVPTALGVAIARSIERTGRAVGLKWPNDLVVAQEGSGFGGKKLGGMLSSSVMSNNEFRGVVAGLGCNVSWPPLNFDALPDAAALDHLPGDEIEREALAADLIECFDRELTTAQELGADKFLDRYRDRCETIGRVVRVEVGSDVLEGLATDIDRSGALLVEVDGRQHRVDVGDVIHVREGSQRLR